MAPNVDDLDEGIPLPLKCNMALRKVLWLILLALATLCQAHPGNGILVLPDGSVITGDAVGSKIWRFKKGALPEVVIPHLHCHWVTLGLDGKVYAEEVSEQAGVWRTTIHRVDLGRKRATKVWTATPEAGAFLVDAQSNLIAVKDGVLRAFPTNGPDRPFRGSGRPTPGQPALGMVKAMAWGPAGEIYLLTYIDVEEPSSRPGIKNKIRRPNLWKVGTNGDMKVVKTFSGTATERMYAGPNGEVQPWGLAINGISRPILANPSQGVVYRLEPDDWMKVLYRTRDSWQPIGVAVQSDRVYMLESKTEGISNFGPRVTVLEANGKSWVMGLVRGKR